MESFETALAEATNPSTRDLLGAIGLVVDRTGNPIYHHASGHQSLAPDAPPLDPDSIVTLGSAGKLVTHIAALQCVERGLLALDEPLTRWLPELDRLEVIKPSEAEPGFTLHPPAHTITLRHLLTQTSGLGGSDEPLIALWEASPAAAAQEVANADAHMIVQLFSRPLLFDPGAGYCYGVSIYWTGLLISRLNDGQKLPQCIQTHIFAPLGMTSSSFAPHALPERLLQLVCRTDTGLVPEERVQDISCSVRDLGTLLGDLLAPASKLLTPANVDMLFAPQLADGAPLVDLRAWTDKYAASTPVMGPPVPSVNWTMAGLLMQGESSAGMPPGTVSWSGMPNVVWAMNRERGVAMLFATQLVPVDDEKTVAIIMKFFRSAWETFGL
ncbi:beta-lactamase family protein [Mycena vulgaris]|nr:beta-lactamase family protein [Mycena vulgaris]